MILWASHTSRRDEYGRVHGHFLLSPRTHPEPKRMIGDRSDHPNKESSGLSRAWPIIYL